MILALFSALTNTKQKGSFARMITGFNPIMNKNASEWIEIKEKAKSLIEGEEFSLLSGKSSSILRYMQEIFDPLQNINLIKDKYERDTWKQEQRS